jgi:hypothetical protein
VGKVQRMFQLLRSVFSHSYSYRGGCS